MDKIQDQYDDETEGSMNSIKQLEWENFIASELIKLNKFKDSVVSVNFVN
jgi:hypothetical protein